MAKVFFPISLNYFRIFKSDESTTMRLLASHYLGPRLFATFCNGFAFDFVPGSQLDFGLATEKNVYAIVAKKVGEMHRSLR